MRTIDRLIECKFTPWDTPSNWLISSPRFRIRKLKINKQQLCHHTNKLTFNYTEEDFSFVKLFRTTTTIAYSMSIEQSVIFCDYNTRLMDVPKSCFLPNKIGHKTTKPFSYSSFRQKKLNLGIVNSLIEASLYSI